MRHKLLTQVCLFVLESMEQKGMLSQHSVTRVIPPLASMVMANNKKWVSHDLDATEECLLFPTWGLRFFAGSNYFALSNGSNHSVSSVVQSTDWKPPR